MTSQMSTIASLDEQFFGTKFHEFLCEHWKELNCIAENWKYKPHDYGVKGVHFVGGPHMVLWSILKETFKNYSKNEKEADRELEEYNKL